MDVTNLLQPPQVRVRNDQFPQLPQDAVATPEEIKARYEYAKALTGMQQPVRHWSQGVSNMVNALMGGGVANYADALSRQRQEQGVTGNVPFGNTSMLPKGGGALPFALDGVSDAPSETKTAALEGASKSPSKDGSTDEIGKLIERTNKEDNQLERAGKATRKQESGGDYSNVTTTRSQRTGKPQSAIGAYGIMDFNVGPWTQEVLGRAMTPEEFRNDRAAQDQVYRAKMGQYIQKYGVEGAGRAWLGGEGGVNNPQRRDPLGTSVGDYGKKFATMVGPGAVQAATAPQPNMDMLTGGTMAPPAGPALNMIGPAPNLMAAGPMQFSGQPAATAAGVQPANGLEAITQALKGGNAASAAPNESALPFDGRPVTTPMATPVPQGGWDPKPILPPGMIPTRPMYSQQQLAMQLRMANTPAERMAIVANYMQQFQPIEVPVTGGKVVVDRTNPMNQKFVPALEKGTLKLGDITKPQFNTIGPFGEGYNTLHRMQPTPNVQNVPTKPGVPAGPNVLPQPAIPFAPETPSPGPRSDIPAPFKVASASPDIPVPAAQSAQPMGALAAQPPTITDPTAPLKLPTAPAPTAAPTEPAPVKVAQADVGGNAGLPPISGLDPEDQDTYRTYQENQAAQARNLEGAKKSAENYGKRYDAMVTGAVKTREEVLPHLQQALSMLNNKDFYSGLVSDPVLWWKKAQAALAEAFPNAGFDKEKGKSMQVFSKSIADSILSNMKNQLGGLGQIRVAEIQLLQQANASPHNTPEANRTLLNMAIRVAQRQEGYAEMAQDYASGAAVINPFSGNNEVLLPATGTPRAGGNIDPQFDRLITKVSKDYPAFTKEEIADQKGVWERDKAATPPTEKKYQTPSPAKIELLRKMEAQPGGLTKEMRDLFESHYGPADKYLKPKGGK